MRAAAEFVAALSLAGLLAACSAPPDDPNPPLTAAERASLQNECAKIADRSEREDCLQRAAFAKRW